MSSLLGREITGTTVYVNTVTLKRIVILISTLHKMCMDVFITTRISVYCLVMILSAYIGIMIACLVVYISQHLHVCSLADIDTK